MLDRGANPYIRDGKGVTHFDRYSLFNLKNLPSVKSAFFTTKEHPISNHSEPWCYSPGVYDGKFIKVIDGKKSIKIIGRVIQAGHYFLLYLLTGLTLRRDFFFAPPLNHL